MSTDSVEIIPDGQIQPPDELQNLLKKQIELARQGNIGEIEVLSKQASSLVGKIALSGVLESSEFKSQHEQLRKLYQDLRLALTAQKAETAKEINRVRKGKKTVEAYRNNI